MAIRPWRFSPHNPDVLLRALVMQMPDRFGWDAHGLLYALAKGMGQYCAPGCRTSHGASFKRLRAGPAIAGIFYRLTPDHRADLPERPSPAMLVPARRLITAASTGSRQVSGYGYCKALATQAPLKRYTSSTTHLSVPTRILPGGDKGDGKRHQPPSGQTAPQTPRYQGRASTPGGMMADAGPGLPTRRRRVLLCLQGCACRFAFEALYLQGCRSFQPSGTTEAVTGKHRALR